MPGSQKAEQFVQLLGPGPRQQWNAIKTEYNATHRNGYSRNQLGYLLQRKHFIARYIEDLDAKGTQMDAISAGSWKKPVSETNPGHRDCFVWLMHCYNYLPGPGGRISNYKIKKYYFKTFPDVWQKKYSLSGKVFADSNMSKIDTYMKFLKQEVDKNQKKSEKDRKRKQNGNDPNQKKNGYKNKKRRDQDKGGGKHIGKGCCPKHPNAPHTWRE